MKKVELAGIVLYDDEGGLLLLHRNTLELTQWELPGGKIEPGESAESAAIREANEEVGVSVVIARGLGMASFEHEGILWDYFWFEAEDINDDKPVIKEPQTFDNLKYWKLDELRQMTTGLSPNIINLLKAI